MHAKRPMNPLLFGGVLFLIVIGFIVPSSLAAPKVYPGDHVWEDTFDDNTGITVKTGNVEVKNNEIVLKQEQSKMTYDFARQSTHKAYAYPFYFFIPFIKYFSPENHLAKETPLGKNDLIKLKYTDGEYASRTSYTFRKVVVHHFRFSVDLDENSLDSILVSWRGNVDSTALVNFYYWNSTKYLNGGWENLVTISSTGSDTWVNTSIPGGAAKYAVGSDDYIDISVVAHFALFRSCTLSTDYIGLQAQTDSGYSTDYGIVETTKPIDPLTMSNISTFYWESLAWDDSQSGGTEIRYQVLYVNESGKDILVDNTTLPGNAQGFRTSPVPLHVLSNYKYGIKYNKLKIRANLTTKSPSISPRIFNWAMTWQDGGFWQDSFSSFYRIEERSKIIDVNGTLMISQIQDEWPFFGFNTENQRASNSKGALISDLYWFGAEWVGGGFRNPVIGNGKVYIVSDAKSLHQYNVTIPSETPVGEDVTNISSVTFDYDAVSSPAVTDKYVIVATGEQGDGGHENHIYAYSIDDLDQVGDFSYGEKICYDASPVVVDDILYISTWGGDNGYYLFESSRYTNNRLLAININQMDSDKTIWEYALPGPGLSTPAVSGDIIIVTCNCSDNDSVVALSLNDGTKLWSKSVGAVGHASPVVYEDTVFITASVVSNGVATTNIVALDMDNGDYIWNATLSELNTKYKHFSDSTPAVYNGVLFAASPDGTVHALEITNGSSLWSSEVYAIPSGSTDVLLSSPAYAENQVYIGTPAGIILALNATTGKTTWDNETFPIWTAAPIFGSPVISDGLVFIADENGVLYSFGKFTATTQQVTASIISTPIRLPEAYWWNQFHADVTNTSTTSTIKFTLLDENGNVLKKNLLDDDSFSSIGSLLGRTIRLQADFTSNNISNISNNPKLQRWYITLKKDTVKPFLDSSSFTPDSNGWLSEVVPIFSIKTKDNTTGLRVSSARYTLKYILNNVSKTTEHTATCTGVNGTTATETITMNISALSFFDNITSLESISFSIDDLAGNSATKTVTFKQDIKKPTSHVKATLMKKSYNSSYVLINATSNDTGTLNVDASGIKRVELYYRYSETSNFSQAGDWVLFANSTQAVKTWNLKKTILNLTWAFNFTDYPSQPGGYFEFCTVATDNANHVEDFPSEGDLWFLYDWTAPELPSISGDTLWFNERPQFSVVFEDDYRLNTIKYRPNFESTWTTIASNVNESIYDTEDLGNTWSLKQEFWDQMIEGDTYYLYFMINDMCGNTRTVTSLNQAISIRKDTSIPVLNVDVSTLENEWSWAENYTVTGIANDWNGSGIKEVLLYYRFSEDKSNWSDWTEFGDIQDTSPFEWIFNAGEGDGYYELKINVTDYADNSVESEVFSLIVASFPMTLALVLLGLVIVLLLISSIIFLKWRKRQQ